VYYKAVHHPLAGVHTHTESLDWQAVIGQKDQLVGELRQTRYVDVLASYGDLVTLVHGPSQLRPDGTVVLEDGSTISAQGVVLAAGPDRVFCLWRKSREYQS
jgi:mercuric reductase